MNPKTFPYLLMFLLGPAQVDELWAPPALHPSQFAEPDGDGAYLPSSQPRRWRSHERDVPPGPPVPSSALSLVAPRAAGADSTQPPPRPGSCLYIFMTLL